MAVLGARQSTEFVAERDPPDDIQRPRIHQGIQIHDARLEIAVNELAARGENVRQLRFQGFGTK